MHYCEAYIKGGCTKSPLGGFFAGPWSSDTNAHVALRQIVINLQLSNVYKFNFIGVYCFRVNWLFAALN